MINYINLVLKEASIKYKDDNGNIIETKGTLNPKLIMENGEKIEIYSLRCNPSILKVFDLNDKKWVEIEKSKIVSIDK